MDATNRCYAVEIAGRIRDQRAPGCVGPPVCAAGKGMQNGKLAARGQFVDVSTTIVITIETVTRRSGYAVELAGRITDKSGIRKAAVGSTLKGIENGISLRRCRLYAGGKHSENSCKDCHHWDSPSIDHCDLLASMQIGSGISFLISKTVLQYTPYGKTTHLRFRGRGVSPTEGSCRFPFILLQQTSLIPTGVKSRVLQLRTHRSLASASKRLYSRSTLPKYQLGQPRSISVRLILREIFYLS